MGDFDLRRLRSEGAGGQAGGRLDPGMSSTRRARRNPARLRGGGCRGGQWTTSLEAARRLETVGSWALGRLPCGKTVSSILNPQASLSKPSNPWRLRRPLRTISPMPAPPSPGAPWRGAPFGSGEGCEDRFGFRLPSRVGTRSAFAPSELAPCMPTRTVVQVVDLAGCATMGCSALGGCGGRDGIRENVRLGRSRRDAPIAGFRKREGPFWGLLEGGRPV